MLSSQRITATGPSSPVPLSVANTPPRGRHTSGHNALFFCKAMACTCLSSFPLGQYESWRPSDLGWNAGGSAGSCALAGCMRGRLQAVGTPRDTHASESTRAMGRPQKNGPLHRYRPSRAVPRRPRADPATRLSPASNPSTPPYVRHPPAQHPAQKRGAVRSGVRTCSGIRWQQHLTQVTHPHHHGHVRPCACAPASSPAASSLPT